MTSARQSGAPRSHYEYQFTLHVPRVPATGSSPETPARTWSANVNVAHKFDSPGCQVLWWTDGMGPRQSVDVRDTERWSMQRQEFDRSIRQAVWYIQAPQERPGATDAESNTPMSRHLTAYDTNSRRVARDLRSKIADVRTLFRVLEQDQSAWPALHWALKDSGTESWLRSIIEDDLAPMSAWPLSAGVRIQFLCDSDRRFDERS